MKLTNVICAIDVYVVQKFQSTTEHRRSSKREWSGGQWNRVDRSINAQWQRSCRYFIVRRYFRGLPDCKLVGLYLIVMIVYNIMRPT